MRVTKKINNNVVLARDNNHQEVILIGNGIGFPSIPYTLNDLSKVDRTFYNIDSKYYGLLQEIPETTLMTVSNLLDQVRHRIRGNLNPNLVFILADHINFAVTRQRQGMDFSMPYSYELEYEYPELTEISRYIVRKINERMNVHLDKGEITCITTHFLNAMEESGIEPVRHSQEEAKPEGEAAAAENSEGRAEPGKGKGRSRSPGTQNQLNRIIAQSTRIIEQFYGIRVERKGYPYFRFKNHLKFLLQRRERGEEFKDTSEELFQSLKKEEPKLYECATQIDDLLLDELGERCSHDELLYLMIHINQLYKNEDCNRKGITPE